MTSSIPPVVISQKFNHAESQDALKELIHTNHVEHGKP